MKKRFCNIFSLLLTLTVLISLCVPVTNVFAAGENLTEVTQWNLVLGDQISANFHVKISGNISSGAVMNVTDGYCTTAYAVSDAEKDASGNYIFTAYLAAAQLTDTITLQLIDGAQKGELHSYCAIEYAHTVLEGSFDDTAKALIRAMLNYGAAAQKYFSYNADNLANAGLEAAEDVEIPAVDSSNTVSGNANGISFYGASLVFDSKVAIRFYFDVTGNISSHTFSMGTPVEKNGRYYVEIADLNPQDYDNPVSLCVDNSLTVTYSPLTYISRMANSENVAMADLVKAMYQYHCAAVAYQNNESFEGAAGKSITLGNSNVLATISFDYKIDNGNKFNIALLSDDWQNGYGYFAFGTTGAIDAHNGVSTETLENGFVRVTFELSKLEAVIGTSTSIIDVVYIRGGDYSDANGYIKNITYTVYQPKLEFEGGEFGAGTGLTLDLDNDQAVSRLAFDYKIESGEYFNIALMSDWSNWFGYFEFNTAGAVGNYAGVTTRNLGDGTIRAYVDLTKVTNINGEPSNLLKILYIRGSSTTANGVISNICINDAAEIAPRGDILLTNVGKTFEWANTDNLKSLSFEYKIVSGEKFAVALMPNWTSYYGYYDFNTNGAISSNAGVTTEILEDGYIRVTFDMASLNVTSGTPTTAITMLYFRGAYCEADVYIDNISYEVYQPKLQFQGGEFGASTGLTLDLDNDQEVSRLTFDYKIESGEYFNIALMSDWSNWFGYFEFNTAGAVGNYAGVTTRNLGDGIIRAYIDLTKVTNINGEPSNLLKILYIRGSSTTANGVISNICINDAAEISPRGQLIIAGEGKNIVLDNSENLTEVVFEYKIVNGEKFAVALMPDWSNYYGYYNFNTNGALSENNGVSTEILDDGYIRVTFNMAELDEFNGTPTSIITMMYFSGRYCESDIYIDNIQYKSV